MKKTGVLFIMIVVALSVQSAILMGMYSKFRHVKWHNEYADKYPKFENRDSMIFHNGKFESFNITLSKDCYYELDFESCFSIQEHGFQGASCRYVGGLSRIGKNGEPADDIKTYISYCIDNELGFCAYRAKSEFGDISLIVTDYETMFFVLYKKRNASFFAGYNYNPLFDEGLQEEKFENLKSTIQNIYKEKVQVTCPQTGDLLKFMRFITNDENFAFHEKNTGESINGNTTPKITCVTCAGSGHAVFPNPSAPYLMISGICPACNGSGLITAPPGYVPGGIVPSVPNNGVMNNGGTLENGIKSNSPTRSKDCGICHGTGVCQSCGGSGKQTNLGFGSTSSCPNCHGNKKCQWCRGTGKQ